MAAFSEKSATEMLNDLIFELEASLPRGSVVNNAAKEKREKKEE